MIDKPIIVLSIVVPTLNVDYIKPLFKSFNLLTHFMECEIIVINQTEISIPLETINSIPIEVKDIRHPRFSASNARNFGSSLANGKYIFFLDDDAILVNMNSVNFQKLLTLLTIDKPEVLLLPRGELVDDKYISTWPSNEQINIRNFPRFFIEWNMVIKKNIFIEIGGFCDIGPGSSHMAQAGEAFVMGATILKRGYVISKFHMIMVAHPSLNITDINKLKSYYYGAGYAIGIVFDSFNFREKIYWVVRLLISSLMGCIFNGNSTVLKIIGFADYIKKRKPKNNLL